MTHASTTTTITTTITTCKLQYINNCYYWTSPFFGSRNYPDNSKCSLVGSPSHQQPYAAFFLAYPFNLRANDTVTVTRPYNRTLTFSSETNTWQLSSPSFSFNMTFISDGQHNSKGFKIAICPKITPCHKVINAGAGEKGKEKTPKRTKTDKQAPKGKRIKVILVMRIHRSYDCVHDYVLLNDKGAKNYPRDSSRIYCRYGRETFTSSSNQVYIAYQGKRNRSRGLSFKYFIV
ncbi:putative blastula protease 10-like [Homarus americanus]|uniref:Putative blastula protease 10-like n=1 Tax=Homarus americanus TaxID=6706 RepID=A0A8J5MZ20_HOMAM|nr:putative blastula protease 10-like [Homarus americanus]